MRRVIFATAGLSAAALAAIGLVVRRRWAMPDETLPMEPAPLPSVFPGAIPVREVESAEPAGHEPEHVPTATASDDAAVVSEPSIEANFGPVSSPVSPSPTKRPAKPRARSSRTAAKPTEPATGD